VVGGSLHHLFYLDVKLRSGEDLAHSGNIVLQEVYVQGMSDLYPAKNVRRRLLHHN